MSFAKRFNKSTKKFNIDTTGFNYESLSDLYNANGKEKVYPLTAIYINTKSKYGDSPVFATETCLVNVPNHMLATAKSILEDDTAVDYINAGKVGFTIYEYTTERFNRDCFGVNFVDIE